ncbi:MAG: OmpA family protein [Flavobacteriaceae bacterium]
MRDLINNRVVIFALLFSIIIGCKNTSEKSVDESLSGNEQKTSEDFLEQLENMTTLEEEPKKVNVDKDQERNKIPQSIFEIGEGFVYIEHKSFNTEEQNQWDVLLKEHPSLLKNEVIIDQGGQYQINLPDLQKELTASENSFKSFKNLIEKNVTSGSISLGHQNTGRAKISALLGNKEEGLVETLIQSYTFKSRNESTLVLRRLGVASQENLLPILLEYVGITLEELQLLNEFPTTEKINNSLQAKRAIDFKFPAAVETHLKASNCTDSFKEIIAFFNKSKMKEPKRFLEKAKVAKNEFYALNPGWYGENDDTGVTYIDSRRKYIYLPFGERSFADTLIAHQASASEIKYSNGVLGAPNMSLERFTVAHPNIGTLGLGGVLTIEFKDNTLTNVNGPDLYVFEMGKIEPTKLEISKDGSQWIDIGQIEGGTAMVDIESFVAKGATFNYVRLTDLQTFSTVPGADIDAIGAIGGALRLQLDSEVLFDTGAFKLKESATATLENLVEAIKEIPNGHIIIEGHTDNVGSPNSNKTLSENRANEVSQFLKNKLPKKYTFEVKGLGESQPIVPNDTPENKQKNRRVEILVIPSK